MGFILAVVNHFMDHVAMGACALLPVHRGDVVAIEGHLEIGVDADELLPQFLAVVDIGRDPVGVRVPAVGVAPALREQVEVGVGVENRGMVLVLRLRGDAVGPVDHFLARAELEREDQHFAAIRGGEGGVGVVEPTRDALDGNNAVGGRVVERIVGECEIVVEKRVAVVGLAAIPDVVVTKGDHVGHLAIERGHGRPAGRPFGGGVGVDDVAVVQDELDPAGRPVVGDPLGLRAEVWLHMAVGHHHHRPGHIGGEDRPGEQLAEVDLAFGPVVPRGPELQAVRVDP